MTGSRVAFALLLLVAAPASAWERYAGVELGYTAGDFGTGIESQLTALTVSLNWTDAATDLSVAVPFLNLATEGVATERGIGDITLRVSQRATLGAATTGYGALSFILPTGDDDAGLGAGATDVGAAVGFTQEFGANRVLLSVGYILTGDSDVVERDDVTLAGIGFAHRFTRGGAYVSYDARSAAVPGAEDPREISLGGFHVVSSTRAFTAHAFRGLNDGGPDFGVTVGVVQRWD